MRAWKVLFRLSLYFSSDLMLGTSYVVRSPRLRRTNGKQSLTLVALNQIDLGISNSCFTRKQQHCGPLESWLHDWSLAAGVCAKNEERRGLSHMHTQHTHVAIHLTQQASGKKNLRLLLTFSCASFIKSETQTIYRRLTRFGSPLTRFGTAT